VIIKARKTKQNKRKEAKKKEVFTNVLVAHNALNNVQEVAVAHVCTVCK
jgi:hypothetical protein